MGSFVELEHLPVSWAFYVMDQPSQAKFGKQIDTRSGAKRGMEALVPNVEFRIGDLVYTTWQLTWCLVQVVVRRWVLQSLDCFVGLSCP